MTQKFINIVEKTSKKIPTYNQQKQKRFTRKQSQSSDRSIDSKRSRASDFQPILTNNRTPQITSKNQKVYFDNNNVFQQLAKQTLLIQQTPQYKVKYLRSTRTDRMKEEKKQQTQRKVQQLKNQLQLRDKEIQILANDCKSLKQSLIDQNSKRKKIQNENKVILEQLNQKKRQSQQYQIQNKKLLKEKQYLQKQIQFLERINYDEKTRRSQSYREKYLQKEVNTLKQNLKKGKNQNQKLLEEQIAIIKEQKYTVQSHYRALKVAHQTLQKQLQKQKNQQKQSVLQSEEYVKLREKYKKFLEEYKKLRIQYCELQAQLNISKSQIFKRDEYQQLSINLSQSSNQPEEQKLKIIQQKDSNFQNFKQNTFNSKFAAKNKNDSISHLNNLLIKEKVLHEAKQTLQGGLKNNKNSLLKNEKRKFQN